MWGRNVYKFISYKNGKGSKGIISEGIKKLQEVDCCLLGPQVRYEKKNIEQKIQELGLKVPFDVIDMRDYGTMNGEKVYAFAKALMGE